jgi:hypothetical protein
MDDIEITIHADTDLPYHNPPLETAHAIWGKVEDGDVRILCHQKVIEDITRFAQSDSREVGGVLLGEAFRCQGVIDIEIKECIHAKNKPGLQSSTSHFQFIGEIWGEIWNVIDQRYSHLKMVGGVHSHTGYGIFLSSGMDEEIQQNFFSYPWQTALVVDPKRHEGGFFYLAGLKNYQSARFYRNEEFMC